MRSEHFAFAQDTGGQIKGPGRADLFWGRGKRAKMQAGKNASSRKASLFIPKQENVASISSLFCKKK